MPERYTVDFHLVSQRLGLLATPRLWCRLESLVHRERRPIKAKPFDRLDHPLQDAADGLPKHPVPFCCWADGMADRVLIFGTASLQRPSCLSRCSTVLEGD